MNFTGISGQNDRKVSLCSKYITTKKMPIIHSAFSLCSLKSIMGIVFDWRISNMYYLDQAGFEDENLCIVFFFSVVNLWNNLTIYFQSCFKALLFLFLRFVTRCLSICSWKNFLAIIQTMVTWWYGFQSFLASRWQFWLMSMIIISPTNSGLTSRVSTFWC